MEEGSAVREEGEGSCEAEAREADSVCEPATEAEGGVNEEEGGVVREEVEGSCEAEAREVQLCNV